VKGVVNNAAFDAYYSLTQQTLNTIHDNPYEPDSIILSKVKNIYNAWKSNKPDSVLVPLKADKATPEMYAMQVKQELIPWLRYFISTEPSVFWEKVKCPVLALNGEKDIQVYPEQNLTAINSALKKAGNNKIITKILPGLNHLFQTCTKCTIKEYGELEESFSASALKIISDWLKKNIK
jgi:pimeloyl-ACP methyl ester carboxylesterase